MTELTELPTNLIQFLESIEDDILPTDTCLESFEAIYENALDGVPVLLNVRSTFVSTCIGG